jgi:tetratricopeptide (TPR) repeat protein
MKARILFFQIPMFMASLIVAVPWMEAAARSDIRTIVSQAKVLLRDGNALNDKAMVTQAHEILKSAHQQSPGKETLYFLAQAEYELVRLGVGDKESGLYNRFIDSALEKVESIMREHKQWSEGQALFSMVQGYRIARNPVNALTAGPKAYFSAEEAIRLDSANPRAWLTRGIAKLNAPSVFGGDKNVALSSLQRAIVLFESKTQDEWSQPDWGYLDALVWAGWAYEQIDRPADARASYLKALSAEPRAKWIHDMFLSPLERKLEKKGKS